jgi:hypothetical protein
MCCGSGDEPKMGGAAIDIGMGIGGGIGIGIEKSLAYGAPPGGGANGPIPAMP